MQRIKWGSFGKKLLTLMLISAMVPVGAFIIGTYYLVADKLIAENKEIRYEKFVNEVEKVEIDYMNKEKTLYSIASNATLLKEWINTADSEQKIDEYLQSQKEITGVFDSLYVTLEDGQNYDSEHTLSTEDSRERDWYKNAKRSNKLVWTEAYKDEITGKLVITASLPIRDENGAVMGVVGADLKFEQTKKKLQNIKIFDNAQTIILNSNWENINYPTGEIGEQFPDILEFLRDKPIGAYEQNFGKDMHIIYEKLDFNGWLLVSIVNESEFRNYLAPVNIIYIVMGFFILIFVLIFANKISYQITEPLRKLEKGIMEVYKGNYKYRMSINTKDEFEDVGLAINKMLEKIEDSQSNIEQKNGELIEMNEQLQEINIELESSLEQLMATSQMLDNSEEKYKLIMENMYDIVCVLDKHGNLDYVNSKFLDVFEYRVSEILGKHWKTAKLTKTSDVEEQLMNALIEKEHKNFEVKLTLKNDKESYFETNSKRIEKDGEFLGTQIVLKDITKRKKAEESLYKRNEELALINKISNHLNTTINLEELLNCVADDITQIGEVASCSIRMIEDDKLSLKSFSSEIKGWKIEPELELEADSEIRNIEYGKIINIDKAHEKHTFGMVNAENSKVFKENQLTQLMYIPIKDMKKINGIITITGRGELKQNVSNIALSVSQQLSMMIENIKLYEKQKKQYLTTIKTLVAAEEAKDKYTEGHSLRVSRYSRIIAEKLNLDKETIDSIESGAILHDIGKIGISDGILNKTEELTTSEYLEITKHPEIGYKILKPVEFNKVIVNGVLFHHKNYDLTGYPKKIIIDTLPLEAAIIGVADSFDAMTSSRAYRKALDMEVAKQELILNRGTQFDPKVVDIFLDILEQDGEQIKKIIDETA